jgi:hypothetical protein
LLLLGVVLAPTKRGDRGIPELLLLPMGLLYRPPHEAENTIGNQYRDYWVARLRIGTTFQRR